MAHTIRAPKDPQPVPPVICRNREEITRALTYARMCRGLSHIELDERAGFHEGYTGKLEQPFPRAWPSGRTPLGPTLDLWLGALGLVVVLIDANDPDVMSNIDWKLVKTAPEPRAPDMTIKRAQQIRNLRADDPRKWTIGALSQTFGVRAGVILDILECKTHVSQQNIAA